MHGRVLLPVRAWRDSRLQLASEKQEAPREGALFVDHPILFPRAGVRQMMRGCALSLGFSYGRAVAKIVCTKFFGVTLECNTQRICLLHFAFLFGPQGWEGKGKVGDRYNSIPIILVGTVLQFLSSSGEFLWAFKVMVWILLMNFENATPLIRSCFKTRT